MLKLILCLVTTLSFSAVGFGFSHRLYRRKTTLNSFSAMLSNSATKIRYTSSPLSDIFADNFVGYKFVSDKPFVDQWADMLTAFSSVLTKDDITLLNNFAFQLGTTDTDGQLKNIEMYLTLLDKNISSADENILKKSKLYRVLGFSLGLVISILVI